MGMGRGCGPMDQPQGSVCGTHWSHGDRGSHGDTAVPRALPRSQSMYCSMAGKLAHVQTAPNPCSFFSPPPAGMKVPEQTWLQLGGADWSILLCAQTCSWHQAGTGVNRWVHRDTCCSCRPQWYRMGGGGISFDFAGEWQKGCVCWGGAVRLPGWISPP